MELYVKTTSNSQGYPLTEFQELGPIWAGEGITIPFYDDGADEMRPHTVIGWTDLYMGSPTDVHVARVRYRGETAVLIWGGNSGVRVLDATYEPTLGVDDHLPAGWGQPFVWIEDAADLPQAVREYIQGE